MNRCALVIPNRVIWPEPFAHGYADALTAMGWDVILHRATSKYEITQYIEKYGVSLILTECRHGVRQLPIEMINRNNVAVVVRAAPFNTKGESPAQDIEYVDPSDPHLISMIERCVVHTHLELGAWDRYLHGWFNMDIPITPVPLAGNLVRAMPTHIVPTHDLAMVGNFWHKQDEMVHWLTPLMHRLGKHISMNIWGDQLWHRLGLSNVRPLINAFDKFANIFGRASVSANLHSAEDRRGLAVNDRTFEIPMCGGLQVTDNPLASKYLGSYVVVVPNPTEFIAAIEQAVQNPFLRVSELLNVARCAATEHSYFNRLAVIFRGLRMDGESQAAAIKGYELANTHLRGLEEKVRSTVKGGTDGEHEGSDTVQ